MVEEEQSRDVIQWMDPDFCEVFIVGIIIQAGNGKTDAGVKEAPFCSR